MSDGESLDLELTIGAPIGRVFNMLTTAEGLRQWIAKDAECDAVPDGRLQWTYENGDVIAGRFVEVDPPQRVVFTFGWSKGGPDVRAGTTRVTIELREDDEATHLHLRHELVPKPSAEDLAAGWRWFLARFHRYRRHSEVCALP